MDGYTLKMDIAGLSRYSNYKTTEAHMITGLFSRMMGEWPYAMSGWQKSILSENAVSVRKKIS